MANQRAIASSLGLTQATVSMALRNDPGISPATRLKVREAAERMGYRPNPCVASLMARIRTGRPVSEKGTIGVLYCFASFKEWMQTPAFRLHYEGITEKASSLGFHVEPFVLPSDQAHIKRLEKTLCFRGINGLILPSAGPNTPGEKACLNWNRYACAAIGYDWKLPGVDRVEGHSRHQVDTAFEKIKERGYQRIGMCIPPEGWEGADRNLRAGYYLAQSAMPRSQQIPLFVGKPGVTPVKEFKKWLQKWRPDVILGVIGHEMDYLRELSLSTPEDIGLACLNRTDESSFAGIDAKQHRVGATAAEIVISSILRNEYGPSAYSRLTLIEGTWVDGTTLRTSPPNAR